MSQDLCQRCAHPADWHRHDDALCPSCHHQPCSPDTAPYRCLGYDCMRPGHPKDYECLCHDFLEESQ